MNDIAICLNFACPSCYECSQYNRTSKDPFQSYFMGEPGDNGKFKHFERQADEP